MELLSTIFPAEHMGRDGLHELTLEALGSVMVVSYATTVIFTRKAQPSLITLLLPTTSFVARRCRPWPQCSRSTR
jgi:hypothetical protein